MKRLLSFVLAAALAAAIELGYFEEEGLDLPLVNGAATFWWEGSPILTSAGIS